MDIQTKDGILLRNIPDGTPDDVIKARIEKIRGESQPKEPSTLDTVKNVVGGQLGAAANISSNLMYPVNWALNKAGIMENTPAQQKQAVADTTEYGDRNSTAYKASKLVGDVAATMPIGGVLGKAAGAAHPALGEAISSGGFNLGTSAPANQAAQLGLRLLGGAANGGASAAMVDPETAGTGAFIGGAIPGVGKVVGDMGKRLANALQVSPSLISPEVKSLALRAQQLGIDIPADRIADSKPLNALAASLNYVPMSGRAGTESAMNSQLNQALSKTFGQDTINITKGLRDASTALGGKFDDVLKNNTLKIDDQFVNDLAGIESTAKKELGADALRPIQSQIDEILAKTQNGEIDGQAAYNIKKTLDRLGRGSGNEAYHANEMKKSLMEALNRSMGADKAAEFSTVRKQYGNMLALENLAKNGAEGDISVARLANMKNINNSDLQELADIASQFVKPRESAHGAAQRVGLGLGAGAFGLSTGTLPVIGAGMAGSRMANALLNSNVAKNALLNPQANNQLLINALRNRGLGTVGAVSAAQ